MLKTVLFTAGESNRPRVFATQNHRYFIVDPAWSGVEEHFAANARLWSPAQSKVTTAPSRAIHCYPICGPGDRCKRKAAGNDMTI